MPRKPRTPADPTVRSATAKLPTTDQLLVLLTERMLAERGVKLTLTPKDPEPPKDWTKIQKTCPRCGTTGAVEPKFGVKVVRGSARAQSWCKECRASTNYHGQPRKYRER